MKVNWIRQGEQVMGTFYVSELSLLHGRLEWFRLTLLAAQDWMYQDYGVDLPGVRHQDCADAFRIVAEIIEKRCSTPELDNHLSDSQYISEMLSNVTLALADIETMGDTLTLRKPEHLWAWIWSMYECGMAIAAKSWTTVNGAALPGRGERNSEVPYYWLLDLVDDLVDVAELPFPAAA